MRKHGQTTGSAAGIEMQISFLPIPELLALPQNHSFADALTALIEAGISGSLDAVIESTVGEDSEFLGFQPPAQIEVSLLGPDQRGKIKIMLVAYDEEGVPQTNNKETERVQYFRRKKLPGGNLSFDPPMSFANSRADLNYQFRFTHRTIISIANLLGAQHDFQRQYPTR